MDDTPAHPTDLEPVAHDRIEEAPREYPIPREPLTRTHRLVLAALVLVSAVLHLARLGAPSKLLDADAEQCRDLPPLAGAPCYELIPLDEVHYVPDARDIITYGTASDERIPDGEGQSGHFVVHPPVGKLFIAAGITLFGDNPFGWRFFGAVLGTLSTLVVYMLARRLWRSPWWAALAALLLTTEGLWFVQSRVAMLDIYAGFFVLAAIWALVEDRDRPDPDRRRARWWRLAAGLFFGAALATKVSVLPFVAIAGGMAFAWEMMRAWSAERKRIFARLGGLALSFVVVPLAVYVATDIPWFLDDHRYSPGDCPQNTNVAAEWICYHQHVFRFHRDLEKYDPLEGEDLQKAKASGSSTLKPGHPYFGEAFSWPWIGRPVAHYYDDRDKPIPMATEVAGIPNPAIWWAAFLALIPLVWWTMRGGDPAAALIVGMVIAGWGPYLAADVIDRPVFLFYATPLVPFLVLGVVHALSRLVERFPAATIVPIAFAALAVAFFGFFYPVLAGAELPRAGALGWEGRMWYSGPLSDCDIPNAIKLFCWI